jgi:ATP-binding protein involved in chromosome partitioning
MFRLPDIAVPVLGVIENMSGFVAPDTGRRYDIFGLGGGRMVAERTGTVLLGEVPIDPAVRESGDAGVPLVVAQPDSAAAQAFYAVAGRHAGLVSVRHKGAPGPPLRADPDLPIVG